MNIYSFHSAPRVEVGDNVVELHLNDNDAASSVTVVFTRATAQQVAALLTEAVARLGHIYGPTPRDGRRDG